MALPIDQIIDQVVGQFPAARLVIQAPPGAGKSTRLPLALLQTSGTIVMLQPRRLAAVNIAHYLAEQLNEPVGQTIGYMIRGEQKKSAATRLMIITEGVLVRWLQNDPELAGISTVVFDEFHERNLYSDLSLALLLESLALRPDLSLLIMSATLPAEPIQQWLQQHLEEPVNILKTEGRQFPLSVHYRPCGRQLWLQSLTDVVVEACQQSEQGVLVFVPGIREINYLVNALAERLQYPVLSLHGRLSLVEQRQALAAEPLRRVIVATNVAETSLTIDGVDCVVDSGRERTSRYRPHYSASQLQTRYISLASAEQRAGRAARQKPGSVYRLWSKADEHGFNEYAAADIETQDLTQVVAEVSLWGSRVEQLNWLTAPSTANSAHALAVLQRLQVLNKDYQLTDIGRKVIALGADVRLACVAVASQHKSEALRAAVARALATLEEPSKKHQQVDFIQAVNEHFKYQRSLHRWQQRYRFWSQQLAVGAATDANNEKLAQQLLYGFSDRIGQFVDEQTVQLISGARLYKTEFKADTEWVLALNIRLADSAEFNRVGNLLPLALGKLLEHPAVIVSKEQRVDISRPGKAQTVSETRIGRLLVGSQPSSEPPTRQQIHKALQQWLRVNGLSALNWSSDAVNYWQRLYYFFYHQSLHTGELSQLAPTEENLLDQLSEWAEPYWTEISSLNQLKRWNPLPALKQLLDYSQQQLFEQCCPKVWQAPSGREVVIMYPALKETEQGIKARAEVKLQEAFGEPASPVLMKGQQRLTLDLLSPAGRLLQRTEDLASFWENAYPQVRKEMRGRYPKHPWPEQPQSAEATRKTNRQLR
ncbi:ATP-dependent helicase HrpB [Idiomarina seosinensis]|uniref:ATP-dependent helicase HrpB n=1 Tax=Idiomarina seosinensis TaxID=281739 RepID=A0A432ZB98_9GAMM|nr:ATP-dependent helicase HrpB [Idiomarina seosinensis]RUO75179.1 ATP-dependent helicase HrpB [Idiomarina seosinensis]